MPKNHILKVYSGTKANLPAALNIGEFAFATDTAEMFVGLGVGISFVGKVMIDLFTNRPPAGTNGRWFYATDQDLLYLDNGSSWVDMLTHTMTSAQHTAGNWKIFYSNDSGQVVELALGADGKFLKSNGPAAAPEWATAATGAGDVSDYATAPGETSTTSTSPQQKLRLTFTPPEQANYEVTFTAMVSCSDTGILIHTRLQLDDTVTYFPVALELYNYKYEDGAYAIRSGSFVIPNLTAASHNIDLDYWSGESGKTAYIKEAYLIVRKINPPT